jgi:hypothetical protein
VSLILQYIYHTYIVYIFISDDDDDDNNDTKHATIDTATLSGGTSSAVQAKEVTCDLSLRHHRPV